MGFLILLASIIWNYFLACSVIVFCGILFVGIFSKDEKSKAETVMPTLPKVDPTSFHAKWANWMSNDVPREDIVGTPEWEAKYQPKSS